MLAMSTLSRTQRLVLGIFVLLLVDVIWVASSELTEFIFNDKKFKKPFFSTFLKLSLFIVYLIGFLFRRTWWQQCRRNPQFDIEEPRIETEKLLGDPMYIPVKFDEKNSDRDSDDGSSQKSVRFSDLSEVRQMSEEFAEDAVLSRMSYNAFIRAEEARYRAASKLTVRQVAKLAFIFCIIFFFGNLAYQEALKESQPGIVNVLSSTSGLFTLILSAMFPSGSADRFTLSKLVAVIVSISGVVLVSLADRDLEAEIPLGALWALLGALLYAMYLVLLRRRVDNEEKLNVPMFFGFVGFFTLLLMWPGFFVVHYSKAETFVWPNRVQWFFLLLNGLVGTVISELLWLWGCFLTSSLIATLSLSLTIPMTMIADILIKGISYGWMFYAGTGPVFIAFFGVSILTHYENWDPVLLGIRKCLQFICRGRRSVSVSRLRDLDREQTESLIGINSGDRSPPT